MSQQTAMNKLFEKLNELQSVFVYGQKAIPVIYNIIDFMRETVPLLEGINQSIAESTSKIPKAKHQISDVTNATELATTEILDLVDSISNELEKIDLFFTELKNMQSELTNDFDELLSLVGENEKATEKINRMKDKINKDEKIESVKEVISKIKEDSYSITLSLQVQDITSQQLAAVNHLIESVGDKLSSLVHTIGDSSIEGINLVEDEAKPGVVFDADASYTKDKSRQDLVDALIDHNKNNSENKASQEEIDKLFS